MYMLMPLLAVFLEGKFLKGRKTTVRLISTRSDSVNPRSICSPHISYCTLKKFSGIHFLIISDGF